MLQIKYVGRYEINIGLPKACELTSSDGYMELDPETAFHNTLPPSVVRERVSRSEKVKYRVMSVIQTAFVKFKLRKQIGSEGK